MLRALAAADSLMHRDSSLPKHGEPQPEQTIPQGDLQLPNKKLHRMDGRANNLLSPLTKAAAMWMEHPSRAHSPRRGMVVIATIDQMPTGQWLLHASVSYPGHNPSWKELTHVKDAVFGDNVDAAIMLPRKADYVAVHDHTFHIWQLPMVWGIR